MLGQLSLPKLMMPTALRTATRALAASGSALSLMVAIANPAQAQSVATRTVSIPAQPLLQALQQFTEQTGLQVGYSTEIGRDIRSSAISGSMAPTEALSRLLAGTGLTFRFTGASSVTLEPAPKTASGVVQLGAVQVQGDAVANGISGIAPTTSTDPAATEGTHSYTTTTMNTALKMPLTMRETPQSVSIVTRQMIDDKAYLTLDQAMADTPGITARNGASSVRSDYWARGLQIDNILYDGVSHPVHYYARDTDGLDDMDMYDRVEVIKGATGLTTGAGNPSGAINLIRKRPLAENATSVTVRGSSWGSGRITVDHSQKLTADGTLKARIVAAFGGGGSYRDDYYDKDGMVYATVQADLADTTVNVGYSYQRQRIDGFDWGGLPMRTNGTPYNYSPSSYLGYDWAYLDRSQHTLMADVEHRLGSGWKLRASGRGAWSQTEMQGSYTYWSGSTLYIYPGRYPYTNAVFSGDINATGTVNLFGRDHEIVIGANASSTNLGVGVATYTSAKVDPENWDPSARAQPASTALSNHSRYRTYQGGIYGALRLNLTDRLKLIGGTRVTWWKTSSRTTFFTTGTISGSGYSASGRFVPYVGAIYDLAKPVSIYASYTGIFTPQSYYDRNGNLLKPITGTNLEAGLKGEFFDKRLTASVALFNTMRDNVAQRIAGISYCNPLSSGCYEGVDGVRTRGVELEMRGALTPRWNITAGYTYADSKYTHGSMAGQRFNTYAYPTDNFKLSTSWRLPGDRLTVGGGVRAQSRLYYQATGVDVEQGAYAIVDLMARYDFSKRLSLQVNVSNLLDKTYYNTIDSGIGYDNYMGAPRNVTGTVKYQF